MNEALFVYRTLIVNYMLNVGNIESARSKVGANEHRSTAALELIEGKLALFLLQASMIDNHRNSLFLEERANLVDHLSEVAEDDCRLATHQAHKRRKRVETLFLRGAHKVEGSAFLRFFDNICKVELRKLGRRHETRQFVRVGCREEEATHRAGHLREQLFHLLFKAKFKRLVELVEDKNRGCIDRECAARKMVVQAAGSSNDNGRHRTLHRSNLLVHRATAMQTKSLKARSHHLPDIGHLTRKLARGKHHHSLNSALILAQNLEQRKKIGKSLSRTRGREYNNVTAVAHRAKRAQLHVVQHLYTHSIERSMLSRCYFNIKFIHTYKKIRCKDSANERNASLLAGYKVSAAYLRKKSLQMYYFIMKRKNSATK